MGVFENCLDRARQRIMYDASTFRKVRNQYERLDFSAQEAANSFRLLNYSMDINASELYGQGITRIVCNPQPHYGEKMNNRTTAKDIEETLKNIDTVTFQGINNGSCYPESDGICLNKAIPVHTPEKKQQIIDRLNKALAPILKELHEEKVAELEAALKKKS